MNTTPLLFATGMAGIDAVAFSIMKKIFEKTLSPGFTLVSMALYSLQPLILWRALSFESVTVMNILWDLISDIIVTIVGVFVLGETIGFRKWLGIAFSFIAIYLFTAQDGTNELEVYLYNLFMG